MKQPQVQGNSEDWKTIARRDWQRVKRNVRAHDLVAAGFFLQQCVEKYLKAFLIEHGWKLKKIHELDALLDDAVEYASELEAFYDVCERISGYYLADRYPPLLDLGLTLEDMKKDLKEAKQFIRAMFPGEKMR
jgi:HEPN domain-containing protein